MKLSEKHVIEVDITQRMERLIELVAKQCKISEESVDPDKIKRFITDDVQWWLNDGDEDYELVDAMDNWAEKSIHDSFNKE